MFQALFIMQVAVVVHLTLTLQHQAVRVAQVVVEMAVLLVSHQKTIHQVLLTQAVAVAQFNQIKHLIQTATVVQV
jgi:hypothetical protein